MPSGKWWVFQGAVFMSLFFLHFLCCSCLPQSSAVCGQFSSHSWYSSISSMDNRFLRSCRSCRTHPADSNGSWQQCLIFLRHTLKITHTFDTVSCCHMQLLYPFAVGSRPTRIKCFIFCCRRKRLFKKNLYCFQDSIVIIRLGIDLADKCFPLFLHGSIIVEAYNLLKLFNGKTMFTV